MDKYRYVATINEYLDYCLELLALSKVSHDIKRGCAAVETSNKFPDTYQEFIETLDYRVKRLDTRYGIKVTSSDILDIIKRAGVEYSKVKCDLSLYLNSSVVQEFKVRFLGNKLDDWNILDFWIFFLGEALATVSDVSRLREHRIYRTPAPKFNIRDIASITHPKFNCAFDPYYWAPARLQLYLNSDTYNISGHFVPAKFASFCQHISWIATNNSLYPTNQDKQKAIFQLVEFVFGTLRTGELIWVIQALFFAGTGLLGSERYILHFFYEDEYEWEYVCSETSYDLETDEYEKFADLHIAGGYVLTDEAVESLRIYRSENRNLLTNPI